MSRLSIRNIVLAGNLGCAILPAIVLAFGSFVAIRAWTTEEEIERAESHAEYMSLLLDQSLKTELAGVKAVSDAISLIENPDRYSVGAVLDRFMKDHPMLDVSFAADAAGNLYAASPEETDDGVSRLTTSIPDRDYFQQTMATQKPMITRNILIGKTSKKAILILCVPNYDSDGNLVGVVAATMWVKDLQDRISSFKYGATGRVTVVTEDGTMIANSYTDLTDENLPDFIGQEYWREITSKERGSFSDFKGLDGKNRVGGFATLDSSGWKVWVTRTHEEIDNIIIDSYVDDLIWFALAVGVAGVFGYWLTTRISQPIESVRATAVTIADGDLSHRAPVDGPMEVVELALSVNKMADSLEQGIADEREVKERLETSVKEFAQLAARVSSGDLTARISGNYDGSLGELGDSLNQMTISLSDLVSEIRDAASRMATATSEILAATSQQVSATAEEATAVRQTAATVAEVREASELATRKAKTVSEMAQKMAATTDDGRKSVTESIRSSEMSKERMEDLAERILAFSEQAEAIAEINSTVGELAEQSNLLAVNAGIEAAKAGEAGKGFAVVAGEVKGLAERSKEATLQVRRIVSELQKSAQSTVIAAEQGVKAAETGADSAKRSGDAIGTLMTSVTDASQAAHQIMATSQQQEAGMEQIVTAIKNIEQSSAQTVAAMQQVESAAKDLNELAQRLSSNVQSSLQND